MPTPLFVIIFTIIIYFYEIIITLFKNIVNLNIPNLKYHDFGITLARFCSFPVKASMLYLVQSKLYKAAGRARLGGFRNFNPEPKMLSFFKLLDRK